MAVKSGYKQTDVGVIPMDWNVSTLRSLGLVIRGSSPRPKGDKRYYGGNVPRLMVEDVTRDKKFVTPQIDFLTVEGAKHSRPCKRGTLTVVCSGTPAVVGLPSFLAVDACIHDGMMALINVSSKVVPDYLFHQLTSHQEWLYSAATHGGTFVNLTTTGFGAFKVVLPPTEIEQRAIATTLSDVDALLGSLDRLISKKRSVKQAAMQQLLTGQTRLPGFNGAWQDRPLREVCTKIQDGTHFSPKLGGNDFLYVTSKNIGFGTFDVSTADRISAEEHAKIYARCDVKKGDLLLTKDGANTGNCALNPLDEPLSLLSSVALLRFDPRQHVAAFFLYQILSDHGQRQITDLMSGNAITRLTFAKIKALRFAVASREEQIAIAEVLLDMDAELAALEQRRDKTRLLKQGIMQELLTGRKRLL
jgi:type I restriction enzyme S subunit